MYQRTLSAVTNEVKEERKIYRGDKRLKKSETDLSTTRTGYVYWWTVKEDVCHIWLDSSKI